VEVEKLWKRSQIPWGFQNPLGCRKAPLAVLAAGRGVLQAGPARISGDKIPSHNNTVPDLAQGPPKPLAIERPEAAVVPLVPLVHGWLAELQIQGRSNQTIDWYRRRMNGYLGGGGARTLDCLTGPEPSAIWLTCRVGGSRRKLYRAVSRRSEPSPAGLRGRATRSTPRCSG